MIGRHVVMMGVRGDKVKCRPLPLRSKAFQPRDTAETWSREQSLYNQAVLTSSTQLCPLELCNLQQVT